MGERWRCACRVVRAACVDDCNRASPDRQRSSCECGRPAAQRTGSQRCAAILEGDRSRRRSRGAGSGLASERNVRPVRRQVQGTSHDRGGRRRLRRFRQGGGSAGEVVSCRGTDRSDGMASYKHHGACRQVCNTSSQGTSADGYAIPFKGDGPRQDAPRRGHGGRERYSLQVLRRIH